MQSWAKRWTALFQVHSPGLLKVNQYQNEYWEWLTKKHGKPIYMLSVNPEIPDAVQYPLDEIKQAFPFAEPKMFGSSVTYMLALAAYLKYEKVELYGVEMKWESEYGYQRETFLYWYGLLQGMGIKIERHCGDGLFSNPTYGVETNWIETPERFARRARLLGEKIKRAEAKIPKWKKDIQSWTDKAQDLGILYGRKLEAERYQKMLQDMLDKSGQSIIDTGEPERAIKSYIPILHTLRMDVERAMGANDTGKYSELVIQMSQVAGRIKENEDLKKESPL